MAHPGGAVEPRKNSAFLDALRQFHQGRGTPFKKTPLVGGREIDLHSLYTRVTSLGGYHKVTDKLLWEDIVEDFNFPRGCSNAPFALKQCYKRYLETYEKVHHFGEEDDEFQGSSRPQTPVGGISYTYNYQQHNVPDHMRQGNGLSTELLPASEYRKLALSLLSGLPNEVDFAVNVCTLLSHEGRRAMHLDRDPRLVALLLAHAGVFDDSPGSLFNVYDSEWRAKSGRDFIKFWKQSIDDLEVRELICDKNKGRTEQRPWGEWLLSTGRSAGVDDPECQRVLQISVILRNLSFLESNAKLMASHRACLRFLIMCAHCKFSSLRQMGLDTLGNIASELQLDPIDFRSTQLIFHTITKCLTSTDKFQRIRGMEILGSLCMAEENGEVVGECVEVEAYCEMVQLLVLPDVLLVLGTLEVLYQLSEIGEGPCSKIARVHRSIECLVSLATLDVQTMGTECLSAVKIVEHHTPAPHVPADSRSTSGASAAAAGGGDAHLAPASGASRGSLSTSALGTAEVDGETFACQWMNSHFEASSDSSISRTDMYSEYLSTCSKLARSSILTSTAFSKGLKTIFPGLSYKRIEDPLNPGHVQYHIVGVRRRPSPLPAHAAFVPHRPGTPNRAGGLNSGETTATHAALPCPGSAPGGTAPSPGIGLQGPMVTLQRPPQMLPTHQSPCPPVIYTTSTIPPPPLPLLPPPPPYQPTAGRTTGQPAMSHSFPAYQTVVVSSCSAANKPGMGVIMTQARLPVSSTITGTAQQGGVVVHANAQPGQQQQQQPGVLHFSQAGQVITSQGTVQTTYAVVSSTQFMHVTQSSGFPVLNSSASPATMVVTTPGVQPAGALVTTQVQPGAAPAGSPVVVGGGGCGAGGIPVGQPMLQITQPPSAITACHIPVIQSAAQPSGGVANHVQVPQTMDVSVQNSVARFQVVSQHQQQQQPLNQQQQQHLALYQGQVHHVTSSAGHVAFLHQALPTQGGSAVAAAVGPAAATSQQEPAMLGAAPHQQQHHALASAPTVIQSPTRHTFQNIAPKPASGTPTPAPSLQSPQQVHVIVGQQGGTCVAPGGPQHVPAVHQIVLAGQPHQRQLAPTPHGGGGGISSMAGVQPQMSACVAPQVVGIPSGVPTLNQMLTIRCQHQQQQQQQQPIQPAVSGAAAQQQATPMQDSTSPLVKQLLLPRRNAVTPTGKMILAVPQTSQTLPRPASPQVVYQVTSGPGAGGLVTAQGGQLQQFVVGQAGPASGQHLVVGQAGGQQIIVGQATCPHAPQIVVGPATSGQQIVMSGQPQVVGSGQPTLPGTPQQQQQQQQQLLVGPTTNHGLPTQQIVMGQPASHLPGAQAHPFLVGQSSFQVIHHTSQSGIQTLPISHMQLVPGPIISSGASQVAITMMPSTGFAASSAGNSSVISATPATHNHGMPALNNISSPLTGGGSSLWQNQTNLAADGVLSLPPPAGAVAPELKAEALGTPMGCDDSKNSPTRPPDSPSRPAANGEASATNFSALPNGRNNKVELPLSPPCPGNMTCDQQQQQQQINPVNLNSTGILDSTQDLKSELLKQQQRPLVNGDSDMTKGEETYIPNSIHNHKATPVQNHMGNGELSDERDSKPQCLPSTNGPTSALRSGCDAPSPTLPPALSHNGTAPGCSPKPQAPHGSARSEQCPAAPLTTTATPAPTTNPSPTPMLTMTVSHDGQTAASAAVHPVAPKDGDCKRPPLKRPHDGSDALLATAVPNKVGVRIVSAGESLTRTVACAPAEMVQQQQQQATQQVMQIPSAAIPATPTPPPPPPPSLELTRKPNQHFMCLWKGCRRWFETNGHVFRHAVSEHGRAGVYPGRCLWEACEAHDRQRLSFITHLQDKHCTKEALQAGLKKLEEKIQSEKQQQQPSSHAPSNPAAASMGASARPLATPPLAGTPPGFAAHGRPVKTLAGHPGAAMLALRRGSRSLTFRDFTDDKEGPITKSIRITACLVLRNIARHSESGRRLVRRHEAHLSTMALSGMEGSSTLAKCLYELAQHPPSPQRRHARFTADDDQRL